MNLLQVGIVFNSCMRGKGWYLEERPVGGQPSERAADWHRKGISAFNAGNYEEAISATSKAIQLDPKSAPAYYNRGIAYRKLGDDRQALEDFKIAARLGNKPAQDFLRSNGITW